MVDETSSQIAPVAPRPTSSTDKDWQESDQEIECSQRNYSSVGISSQTNSTQPMEDRVDEPSSPMASVAPRPNVSI